MPNEKRDWVQILVAPLLIGVIGVILTAWFGWQQNQHQNALENRRAESERKLEELRTQDAALQAYLDQMSSLLLNKDRPLRQTEEGDEVRTLAQARTSTVIQRLDADHNRTVMRFLTEAGLTGNGQSSISILAGADLQGAHLEGVDLSTIDLSSTVLNDAKLDDANLTNVNLSKADLSKGDLSGANLEFAELRGADLSDATLTGADLNDTNLDGADLSDANLESASLERANLSGTALSAADLSNADLDNASLKGANLNNALLNNASLAVADLNDAMLSGADLSGTGVQDADLRDANQNGILQDKFSDSSGEWTLAKYPETDPNVIEYAKGGLRLYNPPPANEIYTINHGPGSDIKDVIVEVEATMTGEAPEAKDVTWGIVCRTAGDLSNRYELGIYSDGRPTIWKQKDHKWTELHTGSPSDAVRGATTTNHLRAKCWDSRLTLFVNGRRVLQVEDSEIKSGSIGFFVDNASEEAVEIVFDNVVVTGPPPHVY